MSAVSDIIVQDVTVTDADRKTTAQELDAGNIEGLKGRNPDNDRETSSEISPTVNETKTDACFARPDLPVQFALPKKVASSHNPQSSDSTRDTVSSTKSAEPSKKKELSREKQEKYNQILASINYHPPANGASCGDSRYKLEVLKNGTIVDTVEFSPDDNKGYYILGRIPGCDVVAENPTISRLHAVFQFVRCPPNEGDTPSGDESGTEPAESGLYLFDLKSTHGTFINKNQVYPQRFYRIKVGHVLRFGTSNRMYIVGGPEEDEEMESEKTVSDLMNEKLQKDLERKRLEEEEQLKRGIKPVRDVEVEGINWGMAEDADEDSDMRINPFAMDYEASELSLDNPKKTLKSWFEREGCDLEYEMKEKSSGQYVCRIGLPLDGPTDAPVYAESEVKGKKKEAALDAAMKACQILDSHGLLRPSQQGSRKRKEKKWADEDYYSSDEDTYLDRTGSVEKKREKRMRIAGNSDNVETYESLCAKRSQLEDTIKELQEKISQGQPKEEKAKDDDEVDIDDYVNMLQAGVFDTKKLKARLKESGEELQRVTKLMEIAKPTELPKYLQKPTEPKDKDTDKIVDAPSDETIEHQTNNDDDLSKQKEAPVPQKKVMVGPMKSFSIGPGPGKKKYGLIQASALSSLKAPAPVKPISKPESSPVRQQEIEEKESESENEEMEDKDEPDDSVDVTPEESLSFEKCKKKRQRYRNQQKNKKPGEKTLDYEDPNYTVWVPPKNQSGDGRTSLNEKLGY